MKRIAVGQRENWVQKLRALDFDLAYMYDKLYWDERHAYEFSLAQVEDDLEDPSQELYGMCLQAVDRIVGDEALMTRMAIPPAAFETIRASWKRNDPSIYGRFDFSYDGKSPAKLLEFNADTPTSLYESAVLQWEWLAECRDTGMIPSDADQFNSIHDKLISAFQRVRHLSPDKVFHLAASLEDEEDAMTLKYMGDCAVQAELDVVFLDVEALGYDDFNWFTDQEDFRINQLFKLYPLEFMMREDFSHLLFRTPTKVYEPLWKAVLSNKGLLPVLWEMFPGHKNLLPSFFSDDPKAEAIARRVTKPLLSREGANVSIATGELSVSIDGTYGKEGFIVQEAAILPKFGDDYAVIGSWIVDGIACGINVREDTSPVTQNLSRFVPHYIA